MSTAGGALSSELQSRSSTPGLFTQNDAAASAGLSKRRSQSFDATDSDSHSDSDEAPGPQPAFTTDSGGESQDDDIGPLPQPSHHTDTDAGAMSPLPDGRPAKRQQEAGEDTAQPSQKKRRALRLPHENTYLSNLPSADRYFKSLMHRDTINSVTVNPRSSFIITTSVDGWVKFWKKSSLAPSGAPTSASPVSSTGAASAASLFSGTSVVEFVKQYRAHLSPIVAWSCSFDGASFATLDAEANVKVFDVDNFDLINMIRLPYKARTLAWVHRPGSPRTLLAISDEESSNIRIYDGRGSPSDPSQTKDIDTDELANAQQVSPSLSTASAGYPSPIFTVPKVHRAPVHILSFNPQHNVVVSCDVTGFVEYWVPEEPFSAPSPNKIPRIFKLKSKTDLFEFKKTKTVPTTLTFSKDGEKFAVFSVADRHIRVFDFRSAKIIRTYNESLEALQAAQAPPAPAHGQAEGKDGNANVTQPEIDFKLDQMEFGRRLALEREISASSASGPLSGLANASSAALWNVLFDESGHFIIFGSLQGIKFVNLVTDRCVRLLGKDESIRFMHLALFQGVPDKKVSSLAAAASENPLLAKQGLVDPTLFATAHRRARFYMFTRVDPDAASGSEHTASGDRDVFNERPTREEQTIASATAPVGKSRNGADSQATSVKHATATLHTTVGDIQLTLFAELVPKTCKNFVGLAKKGYYDGIIFHRIIKKFMIQTGDPLGDGTGGESRWGGNFEDEFHPSLNHSKPFTLSMANAGPNTNGSQFFITTVPTPWLDQKHTVFGKVSAGVDVVKRIEDAKVDKNDRPRQDIRIVNVSLR
ncbi:related to Peptidylprolyl isomerase domain and WD repeat-containing protein 1 [Melanopsichium pennsylvanicum]|uniref:peptidylprolyl isomerase n=2 Tax=Melanopsichium pennsylvanicum TaxID=63383 RepID=A0AAJ4XLE1_9BASI|nr:related to Peptidylprolyl isomerase domain and WD repeat-containing protein 1 [Melanopsichium pennsylvanicum 4]SNX83891.1 related to Peptidylprolyl isomerase domain and WD repeat-containing protein 1 [Melanopsichium pennsylvanicum]